MIGGTFNNALIVGLFAAVLWLGFSNARYERDAKTLETTNSELRSEVSTLRSNYDTLVLTQKAEQEARNTQQALIDAQRRIQSDTLTQLETVNQTKNEVKDEVEKAHTAPDLLSPDVVRLLNKHCEGVRGSTCPSAGTPATGPM